MTKIPRFTTIAFSLVFMSTVFQAEAFPQLIKSDKVLAFILRYDKAWNSKDVAGVDRMLAKNYIYFSSTGATTSRERTLEFLRSPKYILKSAVRSELKIFRTGDAAVVSSRWVGTGSYNDEPINDDQRCSLTLVMSGNRWQLLSEHCTQIVGK